MAVMQEMKMKMEMETEMEMNERREEIWPKLPPELWIEIFLRLPVRPLLTLKCVSKTFLSRIQTPDFANLHFHRFNNIHTSRFIGIKHSKEPGLVTGGVLLLTDSINNLDVMPELINFDMKVRPDYTCGVMGNVNGLLWMCHVKIPVFKWESTETIIWNPFMRKSLTIPSCPAATDNIGAVTMGFGYDPLSDDYKIVAIVYSKCRVVYEVYSLRSRSWRHIGDLNLSLVRFGPQVNLNQCVYWIGASISSYDYEEGSIQDHLLICYDFHTDKFTLSKLPNIEDDEGLDRIDFPLILNGSVAVLSISPEHSWFWVLDEDWSWTPVFDSASEIDLYLRLRAPVSNVVFFPEECKLMFSLHGQGVVSYCYKTHLMKVSNKHVGYLGTYIETLLWGELLEQQTEALV